MRLALAWGAVVVCAAALLAWRLAGGFTVETGILRMLPPGSGSAALSAAEARLADTTMRKLLILFAHPNGATARDAAARMTAFLREQGLAQPVAGRPTPEESNALLQALARHAPGLLAEPDRDELIAGAGEAVARRALSRSLSPIQAADPQVVTADPMLFSVAFLADLARPASRLSPREGGLEGADGERHVVLRVFDVRGDPYNAIVQAPLASGLAESRAALERAVPGLRILAAGAPLYAVAGTQSAIEDVSRIGIIATVTTLGVLVIGFRSLAAVGLVALPVAVGILIGATAVVMVFPSVHGLALVFGTTLIGTAVDYAIHYVSARYAGADPAARLGLVRMGTLLGLVTTVIGYLAVVSSPFPALRELALFSAAGLAGAWLTMFLWLPRLDRAPQMAMPAAIVAIFAWTVLHARRLKWIVALTLAGLAVFGATRLTALDDIRRFQSLPQSLRQEESEIRRIAGMSTAPVVLTVVADDEETALQREEALQRRLRGSGLTVDGLARYAPSAARQAENVDLVRSRVPIEKLGPLGPALQRSLERPHSPLRPAELPALLGARAAELRLPAEAGVLHLVRVSGAAGPAQIAPATAGLDGVSVLDLPRWISDGFAAQRRHTLVLLGGLAALTFAVAAIRYGWRRGLRTMLVPTLAATATPFILAVTGEPFSFFNAVGLLLVVALGVDYAFCWSEAREEHWPMTALATLISMATTVAAFGLLALSRTEALAGFGATVALGTTISAMLAPIVVARRQ